MSSTSASTQRRSPQQERATQRRAKFLEVAGHLIAERGYDAVTMTAIAETAGASIGTLYDYFTDKPAVVAALLSEYAEMADAHWTHVLSETAAQTDEEFASVFVQGILTFTREHPAYLPLLAAPIGYSRTDKARRPLRRTIATALQKLKPHLSDERAFLSGQVVVELMKGMLAVYRQVAMRDRDTVVAEFKGLMLAYITTM